MSAKCLSRYYTTASWLLVQLPCRNLCHPLQESKPKPGAPQVAAYLEERVNVGVNFVLSAEIDHCRKDYKFGFGMTVGE